MLSFDEQQRFGQVVLPHLDAAFNLAVWLVRSRVDAEDLVQESLLRSYQFFSTFRGSDGRGWLLQIVRNTCYTWLRKNRPAEIEFDGDLHSTSTSTPEELAMADEGRVRLYRELESLSPRFRELIVLRELEGCSYKEIAAILSVPMGTVMSSLSRARRQLQLALVKTVREVVATS